MNDLRSLTIQELRNTARKLRNEVPATIQQDLPHVEIDLARLNRQYLTELIDALQRHV